MKRKIILLVAALCLAAALTGCSAATEFADEGENAFKNGMKTKDQAIQIGEKKEAFDAENDF